MTKLPFLLAPIALVLMAAQPNVGGTAYLSGAATSNRRVLFDGGFGSLPPVQIFPLVAPFFFESSASGAGMVPAISGLDGGAPPGVLFTEVGSLTSATSPAFTVMTRAFAFPPTCNCSISSGASSINVCQGQVDAGGVTTVVIGTLAQDGGTWNYSCTGF